MIALAPDRRSLDSEQTQQRFLDMLPRIRACVLYALRNVRGESREELLAEAIANAFVAFQRLVARGKADLAYPSPLAMYAIKQLRSGRRVGGRCNSKEVLSPQAQRRRNIRVRSLTKSDGAGGWEELVVEDRRATPAEVAQCRLDFRAWLSSLTRTKRSVAQCLAVGHTTQETARSLGLSPGRISQLRNELLQAWEMFQDEEAAA